MALTRQGLTLEEFLALPEEKPALEYADGMVTQKVAPLYERSVLQRQFTIYLEGLLEPPGLGHAFPELRIIIGGRAHVPDLSVYRSARLPRRGRNRRVGALRVAPDLVVEIWSPGEAIGDQVAKCEWYVAHGVLAALLADDRDETVRVFRPGAAMAIARRGDRISLDAIAPGLQLMVDEIFRALDPE